MNHYTSARDTLDTILKASPWNVVPDQRADFAAYLSGIEDGSARSLLDLTDGEIEQALIRVVATIDPGALIHRWVLARNTARIQYTVAELNAQGEDLLR